MASRQHDAKDTLPILPFYPRDWRSSTARAVLSPIARLAYLELFLASWMLPDCALPDSDSQLAGLAQLTLEAWLEVRDEVLAHLPRLSESDGRRQQPRISYEWRKAMANRDASRAAGKAGGEATARKNREKEAKRRSKKPEQMPLDLVAGTRVQQACSSPSPSPSPSPTTTQEPILRSPSSHHPATAPPAREDGVHVAPRSGSDLEEDPGAVPVDRSDYIRSVVAAFLAVTDASVRPRPKDLEIAEAWYSAGIPLPHVEHTLRRVALNRISGSLSGPPLGRPLSTRPIRSLAYFTQEMNFTAAAPPPEGDLLDEGRFSDALARAQDLARRRGQ